MRERAPLSIPYSPPEEKQTILPNTAPSSSYLKFVKGFFPNRALNKAREYLPVDMREPKESCTKQKSDRIPEEKQRSSLPLKDENENPLSDPSCQSRRIRFWQAGL